MDFSGEHPLLNSALCADGPFENHFRNVSKSKAELSYYALPLPQHPLSVSSHKMSHFLADEHDRL